MSTEFIYLESPSDRAIEDAGAILSETFNGTPERTRGYFELVGRENVRTVTAGDRTVGAFVFMPMGQWFGGACVPMWGIAAVGVVPDMRGKRVGRYMLRSAVEEMHRRRVPISTLFPATQPLYRSMGFEQAGSRFRTTLKLKQLVPMSSACDIRPATEADHSMLEELHRRWGSGGNGHLDRSRFLWRRACEPRDAGPATTYVVEQAGMPQGYLSVSKVESNHMHGYDLRLTDVVTMSADAARAVVDFLAHHRSMADVVTWFGSPSDPILQMLREPWHSVELALNWMLRITSVKEAFEHRGYARAMTAEARVELIDDTLPDNAGTWTFALNGGAPAARRGGGAKLRLDIRGFAAMYSGHLNGEGIRRLGLAEGDEETLLTLTAMFAGPAPWMSDMF